MQYPGIGNQKLCRERRNVAQDMSSCERTDGTLHEILKFQFDQNLKDIQTAMHDTVLLGKLCSSDVIAQESNIT